MFFWVPLKTKHSPGIKEFTKKMYDIYGTLGTLQSDNGNNLKKMSKDSVRKRKSK